MAWKLQCRFIKCTDIAEYLDSKGSPLCKEHMEFNKKLAGDHNVPVKFNKIKV